MTVAAVLLACLLALAHPQLPSEVDARMRSGDYEEAAGLLEGQLSRGESSVGREQDVLLLAECYLGMRMPSRAGKALGRISSPARIAVRYNPLMAEVLAARGEAIEAEKLLDPLVGPKASSSVILRVAVLAYERGDFKKTASLLGKLAAEGRSDYYAQIYYARALLSLNRPVESLAVTSELTTRHDTPEVQYLAGRGLLLRGQPKKASKKFRRALEGDGKYVEAAFSLYRALKLAGDSAGALVAMKEFRELQAAEKIRQNTANLLSQKCRREPKDPGAWLEAGEFYLAESDADQAISHAWRALALDKASERGRLLLARGLRESGAYSRAALHYQKVIVQSPGNLAASEELRELIRKHARK